MDKELKEFRKSFNSDDGHKNYFEFEEEFMENNIRCIPMVVRFKLDTAGIKLRLSAWSKFSLDERLELGLKSCSTPTEIKSYYTYVAGLIEKYKGGEITCLPDGTDFAWENTETVPEKLQLKAAEFGWNVRQAQWKSLSPLQRFALLKLCRPGHENRNFPRAYTEFEMN